MCTAITYQSEDHYFGRNLDLDYSHDEQVVVTPRNYEFKMRCEMSIQTHYAMIGMATIQDNYPLYYEATNEKGLSMAGLNFPNNAKYSQIQIHTINITPFELIPYILSNCKDIHEAKQLLSKITLVNIPFNEELKLTSLHWICSDAHQSITIEYHQVMKIYDNPVGVLTNNPPFNYHMMNLNNYMNLHEGIPNNEISDHLSLSPYSLGMAALGLPGDFSSSSRFIKAVFVKFKSVLGQTEQECIIQFFHILSSVAMPKGCVMTPKNNYEYTRYSSCCNTIRGIYYYTTYENQTIQSLDLNVHDLEGKNLIGYPINSL